MVVSTAPLKLKMATVVNGKTIRVTAERDPANLKWNEVNVDVVAEATGLFLTDDTARKHIAAGAKKVVLTGPSKDDTPMFVMGVNHKAYAGQTSFLTHLAPLTVWLRWQKSSTTTSVSLKH